MAAADPNMHSDGTEVTSAEEKKRIKQEQKRLKDEQKKLGKELRAAKAIEEDSIEESEGGVLGTVFVILFIILIWLVLLFLAIKLDVGGFGSNVVRPIVKDIDALKFMLPPEPGEDSSLSENAADNYSGYDSMQEAVARIKELEIKLSDIEKSVDDGQTKEELEAEIKRLQEFEAAQLKFEKLKNDYYDEVVFGETRLEPNAYQKYYAEIDETTSEEIYRQVAKQVAYTGKLSDYAKAYAAMKPDQAAKIFEAMQDDLYLAALILNQMSADDRGKILAAMDTGVAATLTEIMDPAE